MHTGLIGHTGFVGGNLKIMSSFDALYNTQNIAEIRGEKFDLLVCAAPQAKKWWANQNPEADLALIQELMGHLEQVHADRFVLVSSIDVFPEIVNVDETFDCSSRSNHAYGRNRLFLETFVANQFPVSHILRLPGLFGPGLRKNVIFDLLTLNEVQTINPLSQFQWYDVTRLWGDIQSAIQHHQSLMMLATEPVATGTIQARFFPEIEIGAEALPAVYYNVQTCYASCLGGEGQYMLSQEQVLASLGEYITAERVKSV